MAFKLNWVCNNAVLLQVVTNLASGIMCFVDFNPDPYKNGDMRWGLLIDKDQRCDCTKIIARPTFYTHPHFAPSCNENLDDKWFTDYPGLLTDLHVWGTEKMKYLLNCPYTDYDECIPNLCANGATCVDELFDYRCTCADGYEGRNCEIDTNECASGPCHNEGACVDSVNSYSCSCIAGYVGVLCETDVNECSSDPCQNGAVCVDGVNGYTCTCPAGFVGVHCETDVDECSSNPCQNGAACIDGVNGYTCTCSAGYVGVHCETDVNECSSDPCQNGAACIDGVNGYTCTCPVGYVGVHCETDFDECSSDPCQNGAPCVDGVNGYSCTCVAGYVGVHCETAICSPECQNDGTCSAPDTCTCAPCYTDYICNSVISGTPVALGVEDDMVADSQMTASSYYSADKGPQFGRLDSASTWASSVAGLNGAWIQVDFLTPVVVTAIQTQGAGDKAQWVTQYTVKFGTDVSAMVPYTSPSNVVTFDGNSDQSSVKENAINSVVTRYVQVISQAYTWHVAMRIEVIGYVCR